jgi:hypothetical protein
MTVLLSGSLLLVLGCVAALVAWVVRRNRSRR